MIGETIGNYRVTAKLGAGGMGEVFRATDAKLARDVAIKVLPEAVATNPDRLSRFQREAQILASLNHPNIAHVYGLEENNQTRCIVMELVEGVTLTDRLKRGSLPADEALEIAKQIAEALEAAHEKGVIHRDLKPGNVMITSSGHVKVLDFGLAKIRGVEDTQASLSNSPTMMTASTPGIIMGTLAYMSPEQARGKDADRTSDVWAFGCVLYEMLTGRAVFEGETAGEIFAGVLKAEPDWNRLPAKTPEGIRRLLHRCLQKNPKLRFRDSGDVRIEIEEAQSGPPAERNIAQSAGRRRERAAWISAVLLFAMIAAASLLWTNRPTPAAPEMRVDIITPPTSDPTSLAISPDGTKIVFAATSENGPELWLRSLDAASSRRLAGTGGATYPFWSPDNRSIAFFADGKLRRIGVDTGSAQTLTDASQGRGGAWSPDGTILFSPRGAGGLFRISATFGEPAAVTRVEAQQRSHRFPQFLPDGRHFLVYVSGAPEVQGMYAGQLDRPEMQRLLHTDGVAVYTSAGKLIFPREGALFAQDFDPVRLVLTGEPFRLAEQVALNAELEVAGLSASAAGPIVYRTSAGGRRQLAWFDRSGNELGKVGDPDSPDLLNPSISPDGQRLALQRTEGGNLDVWLYEAGRGVPIRFMDDATMDRNPMWWPDGNRIVFSSNRKGPYDLYQRPISGASGSEELLVTEQNKVAMDFSRDGRFLLYRVQDAQMGFDIWAMPLDGDRKPFPVVQTKFEEREPQFSPDGKWIAYQSNETGRFEIYVQPFRGPGNESRISTNGGAQVRWRHDGKELFYIAPDERLMAVPIRVSANGQGVEAGVPDPLFTTHIGGTLRNFADRQQYVVSPDGERFLMNTVLDEPTSSVTVLLNWKAKP